MPRPLPEVTADSESFWRGGEAGELRIRRCQTCGYYVHPPAPVCPLCLCRDVPPEPVSGRAEVVTFSVNHQPWYPGLDVPYVVAIVELAEQPGLRLTTNVVNCPPEDVSIGMPVQVTFEPADDIWLPLFEPAVAQ